MPGHEVSTGARCSVLTVAGGRGVVPAARVVAQQLRLAEHAVSLLAGEPHHVPELARHAHHEGVLRRLYGGAPHACTAPCRGGGGAWWGGLLTLTVRRLLAPLALLAAGDLGGAVELEAGLAGEHGQAGHQVLARGTLPSLALVKTISTFVKIFLQILLFLLEYF